MKHKLQMALMIPQDNQALYKLYGVDFRRIENFK